MRTQGVSRVKEAMWFTLSNGYDALIGEVQECLMSHDWIRAAVTICAFLGIQTDRICKFNLK